MRFSDLIALLPQLNDAAKGFAKTLTTTDPRRSRGMKLSAFTVLALSIMSVVAWLISGAAWMHAAITALAGIALVVGWSPLTGIALPFTTVVVLSLSAVALPFTVVIYGDLALAVPVLGICAVATFAATIFAAPAPTDHSMPSLRAHETSGDAAAASSAIDAEGQTGQINIRRARAEANLRPTTLVFASAICLLVFIEAGTAWTAFTVFENWSILVPLTAVIIAVVVWGDQVGQTFLTQSSSALAAGVVTGLVTSLSGWQLSRTRSLMPIVFPAIADTFGTPVAFAVLGIVAGIAVAVAVIVLDGMLGDHLAPRPPLGTIARGAAKYLVAAIPIYALLRIGGM